MVAPKTARVTLEVTNDDGSKMILQTEDLDASRLPGRRPTSESDPDHMVVGMVDPYYNESNYFQRRNQWADDLRAFPRNRQSHFFLNIQLEPMDPRTAYTITEIEAPDTNVVLVWTAGKPSVYNFDERKAAAKAEAFGTQPGAPIYFILDIP